MPMTRTQAMGISISPPLRHVGDSIDQRLIIERSVLLDGDSCWHWIGSIKSNGYGRLTANRKSHHAHRFSFSAFKGEAIPRGMDVCHACDNRSCVNPAHLFVGSRLDNMQDAQRKGRLSAGGRHSQAVKAGLAKSKETK